MNKKVFIFKSTGNDIYIPGLYSDSIVCNLYANGFRNVITIYRIIIMSFWI